MSMSVILLILILEVDAVLRVSMEVAELGGRRLVVRHHRLTVQGLLVLLNRHRYPLCEQVALAWGLFA